MTVFLIFVGTDLKLTAAGATFHLHILGAGLFLAHHSVYCQLTELQLRVEAEKLLTTLDEGGVEREGDVGCLEELYDVVLLTLVLEFYLVLEVEGGLRVPVDVEVYQVADLGVEAYLYVLVEVEGGDAPFVSVELRVFAVVVHQLEGKLGASAGCDFYLRLANKALQLAAYLLEPWYLAQEPARRLLLAARLVGGAPVVFHQLVHLPILILFKGQIFPSQHHVAHLAHLHVVTRLGIVLHRGGYRRRDIVATHLMP